MRIIAFAALFAEGATPAVTLAATAEAEPSFVTVSGTQFLDETRRPILLHGINVINKSQAEGYTAGIERSDLAAIRSWGMNCVRLGILWDGLEPQPGMIDEAYLERIARIVGWAKDEGLYVLLDMHQDLYSVLFSDGAPAWATLDDGKTHTPTPLWSDAYYASEAVQAALDNFWANAPGPDGVGLQDHYARVWRRVAERFRDEPAVLGYDLMNEPFPGRDAARMQGAALIRLGDMLHTRLGDKAPSSEALIVLAGTAEGREQITGWLGDLELFEGMLAAGTPMMQEFERGRLTQFYRRVHRAIREVDPRHIIFLEPAMSSNMGMQSAIEPLTDEHGLRDPQQAYAPHGYDIVVDTSLAGLASDARVGLIFARHAETARRLAMPVLVGEWGAFYENPDFESSARFVVHQLDARRWSDTYWAYRRTFGQSPLLKAIERKPATTAP